MNVHIKDSDSWLNHTAAGWAEVYCPVPYCRAFFRGQVKVFSGKEPTGWHLSISHPSRYPSWEEIKKARYDLCPPDITMAMLLPPQDEYVNQHPNCFHLYQVSDDDATMAKFSNSESRLWT